MPNRHLSANLPGPVQSWHIPGMAAKRGAPRAGKKLASNPAISGKFTMINLGLTPEQIAAVEKIVEREQQRLGMPLSRMEVLRQLILSGAKAMGYDDFPSHF